MPANRRLDLIQGFKG